jgi:hypothetical protein
VACDAGHPRAQQIEGDFMKHDIQRLKPVFLGGRFADALLRTAKA